ncbi:EVE domain-containing protein [Crenobacter sp. SG2303]|uniref:EVE domain-containing protein n=1 Tax=Crenobacter oryzisoli TaxID=3056844 RepID=A0ABT7XUP5_9NEIS|nr:EVE domain-containing protein [Crenobacter sp. SG2303]MDN0077511.1 EVE domain-containing protein [Crenobacter sp. SG2303]
MNYWLMKSEPDDLSIADLAAAPGKAFEWTGVRNYQARNYMRDGMQVGDLALFWHSSCPEPGVVGVVRIVAPAHPDSTQFEPDSPYYDPKSSLESPRWLGVDVAYERTLPLMSPATLRAIPGLEAMQVLKRGNRLSITPVSPAEWALIVGERG